MFLIKKSVSACILSICVLFTGQVFANSSVEESFIDGNYPLVSGTQIFINNTSMTLNVYVGNFFPTKYTLRPGQAEYAFVSTDNQNVEIKLASIKSSSQMVQGEESELMAGVQKFTNSTPYTLTVKVGNYFPTPYVLSPNSSKSALVSSDNQTVQIEE